MEKSINMEQDLKQINIWNIKYNLLNIEEIVNTVDQWLSEGRKGIHLTGANVDTIVWAQEDELLRKAILDSDIVNVDSFMPTFFLKRKGYPIQHRVPSPDVFEAFLKLADRKGMKIFFLGAKDETLEKLKAIIHSEYPHVNIVGSRNGYFEESEQDNIAMQISEKAPDFLFIGMPSPMKEKFILKYKKSINVGCFYGIGGAFDAKAGVLPRPPRWLRGFGLEFFFRAIRNPKVYGKRSPNYFKFIRMAL